jgi:8-oxo-dGTP pyrophosphatase MutT (NUDIX family)
LDLVTQPQTPGSESTPIPSATLLLLRDSAAGLEVLMIQRPQNASFATGAMVFPGGRIDAEDSMLCTDQAGAICDDLLVPRVAAIREVYEECSMLLARRTDTGAVVTTADIDALRDQEKTIGFGAALSAAQLALTVDALVPFGRWITPSKLPKRFDTHFFAAIAPPGQIAREDGREALEAIWTTPRAVMEASDRGERYVMFPTYVILHELARSPSAAAALESARTRPYIAVLTEMLTTTEGTVFRIPDEAGYEIRQLPVARFRGR